MQNQIHIQNGHTIFDNLGKYALRKNLRWKKKILMKNNFLFARHQK